ncbi:MAG: hypothetical protein KF803_10560 [Cyclobacteriaceae bacterium]|nr:hypothetical protein [Cyclobacteriaceae bacterium]
MRKVLLILMLLQQMYVAAQITVEITGPTTANVGETKSYSLIWRDGFYQIDAPWGGTPYWNAIGGTVTFGNANGGSVQWNASGPRSVFFEYYTWNDFYYDDLMVTVSGSSAPATPNTTFTTTQNCNSTTVQRNSNPPSGVEWYWQTSTTGTSTSLGSGSSINRTTSGNLYLRARQSTSPFTWSTSSQHVGNITVITTPPAVSATSTSNDIISNTGGQVTVSVSAVSEATSYRWYTVASGGTAIGGVSGTSYSPTLTQTTTYYVASVKGNCASTTRRSVTAGVHPAPQVSSTNNGVITMGTPVTLSLNYSYDTYQWKKNGTNISGATSATYQTNQSGDYSVQVSKGTATGVVSVAKLIGSGPSGQNMNYIVSNTILKAGVTEADIDTLGVKSLSQTIQYFDGLGRPIQSVVTQGSPNKKDIVQPVLYDQFGREARKYLPYVATTNDGWYKANPVGTTNYTGSPHHTFYTETNSLIARDAAPYSETIFEPSPLNRVIKQGAPGTTWQPDGTHSYTSNDHTIKMGYEFNAANEVLLWTFTYPTEEYTTAATNAFGKVNAGTTAAPIYYAANQLYKNLTKDEQGNQVVEYVDKQGRTVLKRVQAVAGSHPTTGTNKDVNYASTYYIYDDFGNLVCAIQPEGVKIIDDYFNADGNGKEVFLKKWATRYRWDSRRRMTHVQSPGVEPMYKVYDKRDRLVMSQDGEQRKLNKWSFTKYDALNRPIISGIYVHDNPISQEQITALISTTNFYDTYNGNSSFHGYTNNVFPTANADSSPLEILSVMYYDNYLFCDDLAGSGFNYGAGDLTGQAEAFNRVVGLVTGTRINVQGTNDFIWSVNYYDDKCRTIQAITQNHKGGFDRVTNKVDFVGKVLETKTTHSNNSATQIIKKRIEYDHAGRHLKTWHKVNNENEILLSATEYNELGQPVVKKLHSTDNGVTFKQHVDYRYNIRGWLTRINNSDLNNNPDGGPRDYFGMEIAYNNDIGVGTSAPRYNGLISAMKWSTNLGLGFNDAQLGIFEPTERGYKFTYDAMDRLTASTHIENTTAWNTSLSYHENNLTFDLNGNIKTLNRKGKGGFDMDILDYVYNGNQLLKVIDTGNKQFGFKDGIQTGDDFAYDASGNMHMDKNKDIDENGIKYSHLNLPIEVLKENGEKLINLYDGTGRKLSQLTYDSTNTLISRIDYVGEFFYENDTLKHIYQEEGRIVHTNNDFLYEYHLKDHLGNIRVTFTTNLEQDEYIATLETNSSAEEHVTFYPSYDNATIISTSLYNHTPGGTKSIRLSAASQNEIIGLAKSLRVVPGDTVKLEVYAKYTTPTANNTNVGALIATAITSAFGVTSSSVGEAGEIYQTLNTMFSPGPVLGPDDWEDANAPKAFLNYILFDEDFLPYDFGYDQISTNALETGSGVPHEKLQLNAFVRKPGYVYIYLSNESDKIVDVYFDDFKITHQHSPVQEETMYYPFGLIAENYAREGMVEQRLKYNGKEQIKELGLSWVNYGSRQYMPDLGRWTTIDPMAEKYLGLSAYNYVANVPTIAIDPTGEEIVIIGDDDYVKAVVKVLMQMARTKDGAATISKLASAKDFRVVISMGDDNSRVVAGESIDGVKSSYITFDPNKVQEFDGVRNTPYTSLSHEIRHSEQDYDGMQGEEIIDSKKPFKNSDYPAEANTLDSREIDAVDYENSVRTANGLSARRTYDGVDAAKSKDTKTFREGYNVVTGKYTIKNDKNYQGKMADNPAEEQARILKNVRQGGPAADYSMKNQYHKSGVSDKKGTNFTKTKGNATVISY